MYATDLLSAKPRNLDFEPVIGVDGDGKAETMVTNFGLARNSTHILGYIVGNYEKHTDAKDITPGATGVWESESVQDKVFEPPWASIQLWESTGFNFWGFRKGGGYFDEKRESDGSGWALVHANPQADIDLWLPLADRKYYLHGEFTRDIV